jgi:integrase
MDTTRSRSRVRAPFSVFKRSRGSPKRKQALYYVQFRGPDGDYQAAVSSGQTSKAAAIEWANSEISKKTLEEAAAAAKAAAEKSISLRAWADRFFVDQCPHCGRLAEEGRPVTAYYMKIQRALIRDYLFDDPISGKLITSIIRNDLLELRTRLRARLSIPLTNKVMCDLKIILREALFRGLIQADPTAGVGSIRYENAKRGTLCLEEISALMDRALWATDDGLLAFLFAVFVGMRSGEIRAVGWDQINLDRGMINISRSVKGGSVLTIGKPKWNKVRSAPLPKQFVAVLRARLAKSDPGKPIFLNPRTGKHYCTSWFAAQFSVACAAAKIDCKSRNLSPHSLRHSVATILLGSGASPAKVRAALGWASEEVMAGYTHADAWDYTVESEILNAFQLQDLPSPPDQNAKLLAPPPPPPTSVPTSSVPSAP